MAPAAVVIPESEDDVRRAMEFALTDGVKVAPRSGGHSYVGASAAEGTMVIDLRHLPGVIAYDGDTRSQPFLRRQAWIRCSAGSLNTVG